MERERGTEENNIDIVDSERDSCVRFLLKTRTNYPETLCPCTYPKLQTSVVLRKEEVKFKKEKRGYPQDKDMAVLFCLRTHLSSISHILS